MSSALRALFSLPPFVLAGLLAAQTERAPAIPAAGAPPLTELHGRLETHQGLRVLRTWGSPEERGYAHGRLLAEDIAAILIAEFTARFARKQPILKQARAARPRLIEYPDDIAAELTGLWQGIVDSGVSRDMPELERAFDEEDLLVANALDVFGLMGCSSFTVWGVQAVGGGVLTARNFDWPLTGDHMLDRTVLLVQHLPSGRAVATVAWPGYVGAVTGVSQDGVATFLHVGSGEISYTPEPSSWPSAIGARKILEHGAQRTAGEVFAEAQRLLGFTSPPAGFLTDVVLPVVPPDGRPAVVLETDVKECVVGAAHAGPFVVTNHFQTRTDGRRASKDSLDREQRIERGIEGCIAVEDHSVDVAEAWRILQSVERGGNHAFGTLHALVFRFEPWCFELRLASHPAEGLVAAPSSERRFVLTKADVFGYGDPASAR